MYSPNINYNDASPECLTEIEDNKGTAERAAFYHDMDVIAGILQCFQEENIPVLWRPFHESYAPGSGGERRVRK